MEDLERFYSLLTSRTGIARTIDSRLEFAARYRAQEAEQQVGYESGLGIPHPTAAERLEMLDWPPSYGTAELATWNYLFRDPVQAAVNGLMLSPAHRAILVNESYQHWGAGIHVAWKPGDEPTELNARRYFLLWLSIGVPKVKAIVYNSTASVDALNASYLSAKYAAPLFPVWKSIIPAEIRTRLEELDPTEILIVGGTAVVDDSVAAALTTIAPVERIAGDDRFSTAVAVSKA